MAGHLVQDRVATDRLQRRGATAAGGGRQRRSRPPAARGLGEPGLAAHPAGDVAQGREVAQLHRVVALDVVVLAHGGEDLGLLDGVDAEVGLEVEVGVQQVGRVAGQTVPRSRSPGPARVARRRGLVAGRSPERDGAAGTGAAAAGAGAAATVRPQAQPGARRRNRRDGGRDRPAAAAGARPAVDRTGSSRPAYGTGTEVVDDGDRGCTDGRRSAADGGRPRAAAGVAGQRVQPALPGGLVDDAVGVTQLVGARRRTVGHGASSAAATSRPASRSRRPGAGRSCTG
jgi:hypothetical protein